VFQQYPMEKLAQFVATYATVLLAAVVVATLLTLLLVWTWAGRYGPALRTRYARAAQALGKARWLPSLYASTPWLRRVWPGQAHLAWIPLASFGVIAVMLSAFAELADGIGPNEDLHLFDQALAEALRAHPAPGVDAFFNAVTHLGNGATLAWIGVAVGATLLFRRRFVLLYGWVLALAGSGLLNAAIKAEFERARPGEVPLLATWSFPSGHAMNSLVAYGMLVYLLSRALPRTWMPAAIGAAVTIVMLVGASRLFLYLHYFSDVLAGYAAGLAWLAVCIAMTELGLRRGR
jgi:undecaprenyl-diphosphatase